MKNIETIKQEFKAATGRDLPIFTYEGQLGVLYQVHEHDAYFDDFLPMEKFLNLDSIDFDLIGYLTSESDYADEGEEITDKPIVNPENEQKLIVDDVWSTVTYNQSDEYERELLISTSRYHNWTSRRSKMLDRIYDVLTAEDDEDNEKEEKLATLRNEWEEICSQYSDPVGCEEWNENKADFDNLVKEAETAIS